VLLIHSIPPATTTLASPSIMASAPRVIAFTRGADLVHGKGRGLFRNAGVDAGLASCVLPLPSLKDIAP
jgi:hypothetical protein